MTIISVVCIMISNNVYDKEILKVIEINLNLVTIMCGFATIVTALTEVFSNYLSIKE